MLTRVHLQEILDAVAVIGAIQVLTVFQNGAQSEGAATQVPGVIQAPRDALEIAAVEAVLLPVITARRLAGCIGLRVGGVVVETINQQKINKLITPVQRRRVQGQ